MTNSLQGLFKNAGIDSVGSITPIANIAALRALSTQPDHAKFVYLNGHTTQGDGGEGFFAILPGSNLPDDDGLVVVNAVGTFVRQWNQLDCFAAWWGYTVASADIGPLFKKVPYYTKCHFGPGVFKVNTYPTQAEFSCKFWRGSSTMWNCTGAIGNGNAFDLSDVAFNWVWVPNPQVQGLGYGGGQYGGDMAGAGLSPIEGIGIVSQLGDTFGVGIQLGGAIAAPTGGGAIRATTSVSTGKVQFEVLCGSSGAIAFSTAAYDLTGNIGQSTIALSMANNGSIYWDGFAAVNGLDAYSNGQWMTIRIDFSAQLIWTRNNTLNPTRWNNSNTANPDTGVGGISFSFMAGATPYFATYANSGGDSTTFNFGGSSFVTPLSGGWIAWGAATTLNPADKVGEILSNGNLTTTGAGSGGAILPGTNPINYFLRPQNFAIGGFYCDINVGTPQNYFLTGFYNVVFKGGSIGYRYNQSGAVNSTENLMLSDCDFDNITVDAIQSTGSIKTTLRGCSLDYCRRNGYFSNNYTFFENCYFETYGPATPAELFACDATAILDFLGGTSFLATNIGYTVGDIINFEGSTGIAYFRDTPFRDPSDPDNPDGSHVARQFVINTAGMNAYGKLTGFNGNNYPPALSPNNLLQNDYLFASGNTFYPGSTCTFSGGAAVFTGAQTLHLQTMECQPGDLIKVSFKDTLSGVITALGGSMVFSTGDGTAVATTNFSTSAGVANFVGADSLRWNNTARSSTLQKFIFRVPPGASKMTGTLTTTGGAGTYTVTSLAIYP